MRTRRTLSAYLNYSPQEFFNTCCIKDIICAAIADCTGGSGGDTPLENITNIGTSGQIPVSDGTTLVMQTISFDNVNFANTSFVETIGDDDTGVLGNPAKPFATITGALASMPAEGGVIKIGIGTFNSPLETDLLPNVQYIGSGKPTTNGSFTTINGDNSSLTVVAPTRLVGGTILHGQMRFVGLNNITVKDLGIDCGPDFITGGGTPQDCLSISPDIASNLDTPPYELMMNVIVENVSLLNYQSGTSFHGLILQGNYEFYIKNIHTYFGFAGVVIKSIGGIAEGIYTHGHSLYGIIVKNNTYSYCRDIIVNGFQCSSINAFDGSGIFLDNYENSVPLFGHVKFTNGIIRGTKFGIDSDTLASNAYCDFNNITMHQIQGIGVNITEGFAISKFNNIMINNCGGTCFNIGAGDPSMGYISIDNCQANFGGGGGFIVSASAATVLFRNNNASANTTVDIAYSGTVKGGGNFGNVITGIITPL